MVRVSMPGVLLLSLSSGAAGWSRPAGIRLLPAAPKGAIEAYLASPLPWVSLRNN